MQLANPTSAGGANKCSFADAQARAIERYPLHVEIAAGFRRDVRWRPLSDAELAAADERRAVKHWHSRAVLDAAEVYWVRSP